MNPEQLTSTPSNQEDLLDEEVQKLAMKTHLEVQQREEDIRRDPAERMKFVPPNLRARESVLLPIRSEQNSARTDSWKMVEGGNYCCQTHHSGYQYRCVHYSSKRKLRKPSDTVDLKELMDSRERTGARVLWLFFL